MNGLAVFLCIALQALLCYAGKLEKYSPDNNGPYSDVLANKFAGSYHSSDDAFPAYGPNHNNPYQAMPALPNYHNFYQQFQKTVRDKLLEKANSIKLVDSAIKTKQNGKNTSDNSLSVNPKPDSDKTFEPVPTDDSNKGSNLNLKNISKNYINGEMTSKAAEELKKLQNLLGSRNVKKAFEAKIDSEDDPEKIQSAKAKVSEKPVSNDPASEVVKSVYKTHSNRNVDSLVGTIDPSKLPSEYSENVPIYGIPYYYNYLESSPYYYPLPQRGNPYILNPQYYYPEQGPYNYEYPNYRQYQYNQPEDYYGRVYLNNPQYSVQRGYLPYTYPMRESPPYPYGYSNKHSIPYYLQSKQPKSNNQPNNINNNDLRVGRSSSHFPNKSESEEYANLVKLLKEVISLYHSGCKNKDEVNPVSKRTVYTVVRGSKELKHPSYSIYSQEYSNENNGREGDQYNDDDYEESDEKPDLKDDTANKNKKPVQKDSDYNSNEYQNRRHQPNNFDSMNMNSAYAGGFIGPGYSHQIANINPENPGQPNVNVRNSFGEDMSGGPQFHSVSSHSSVVSSMGADGKPQTRRKAETIVNNNGEISQYKVED